MSGRRTATPVGSERLRIAARALAVDHLCARTGEIVILSADDRSDRAALDALFDAVKEVGARPVLILVDQLPFQGALADPYLVEPLKAAVRLCDVWIDFTFPYLAGSKLHAAVMAEGRARYLLAGDLGQAGLQRLYGGLGLDSLFAVQEKLDGLIAEAAGRTCRVESAAGTDVTFVLAAPATKKLRHADKPGSQTIPGSAVMYPELDSVRGRIVIEAAFHERYTNLPHPITIHVDGAVSHMEGRGEDREILERALRRAAGDGFGHVIHFSCGFHPFAQRTGDCFIEDIRASGSDAVGFGLPWWLPGGGENHPDGVVFDQTLRIGEELVVDRGRIVGPPALAAAAAGLRA